MKRLTDSQPAKRVFISLPQILALAGFCRRWLVSLQGRLVITMALAIVPALVLTMIQAKWAYDRERDTIMAQLGQIAVSAAEDHKEVFVGAKSMMALLVSQPSVRLPEANCEAVLRNALLSARDYANIIRLSADDRPLCAALPDTAILSAGALQWLGDLRRTREMVISPLLRDGHNDEPLLLAGQAFFTSDGAYAGALLVVIQLSVLERMPRYTGVPLGAGIGLVNAQGVPIIGQDSIHAPNSLIAQAIHQRSFHFTWTEPGGKVTLYALAPLLEDRIFVAIAAEQESLITWTQLDLIGRIVLPVLMLAMALAIVGLGGHYLVLRWLNYLRRLAQAYSQGAFHIDTRAALEAPTEFQEVVQTLSQMAIRIDRREQDLTTAIGQRDAMLKEIHHRVKNNLQIVTSLLSIEAGRVNGDAVASSEALMRARARVIAFAQIHQWLYERENFASVGLASFLADYCTFVHDTFGGEERNVALKIDSAQIELPLDTAIPLALFILEAQSDAYLHSFAEHGTGGTLTISTRRADNAHYELRVEKSGHISAGNGKDHATSISLMRGFARQIEGQFETLPREDGDVMVLTFPSTEPPVLATH